MATDQEIRSLEAERSKIEHTLKQLESQTRALKAQRDQLDARLKALKKEPRTSGRGEQRVGANNPWKYR
jgi:septal ring factor EnvC (AmiA/AmiB activator)